ncbi:MAG: metallophosphoesterase [Oscillospiraceae bacterium]|nr:metallophosphoesterase [Oscillospiraceae bacterium]
MNTAFQDEKYQTAAENALAFLKAQMDAGDFPVQPLFKTNYDEDYTGRVFGTVEMPEDATITYPMYICCDQFYDESYSGVCSGKHQNTGDAAKYLGVEVTTWLDMKYRSAICALHDDGTWRTEVYYKETDYYGTDEDTITRTVTYWYRKDVELNTNGKNGIKGFTLKYYDWLDEDGTVVDVDNLPDTVTTGEKVDGATFQYAKTYTLKPQLRDDTVLDSALPYYADYDAELSILADVEYWIPAEQGGQAAIYYDGDITLDDLQADPPELPQEPEAWIENLIAQPGSQEGELLLTWTSNFPEDCTLTFNGEEQTVSPSVLASGYRTYHATVEAPLGSSYDFTVEGNDCTATGAVDCPDSTVFLLAGDPQLIDEDDAENWYTVEALAGTLGAAEIVCLGDMTDAIVDTTLQETQYRLLAANQTVPVAAIRGNHDKDAHFFGHYGLPNADGGSVADFWYTFNGVLFIALDTNSTDCDYHISVMEQALEQEHDWAVLLTHHSLYSTSQACMTTKVTALREGLTDFILSSDIDFVIAGHEHFFCRTDYPGKLFLTTGTCTGCKYCSADYTDAAWSQVTVDTHVPMYTVMTVADSEVTLETYNLSGDLLDSCTVEKEG